MKMDVAFGQYCDGDSILHRLDPRAKILISILSIVVIFLAKNIYAFILVTAFAIILAAISGVPAKVILRGIRPIAYVIIFTSVINIFFVRGQTPLLEFYFIKIYPEGLINAVFIALRVIVLIVSTSLLLTYTTTPISLTDGLEQLLSPLAKIKIPVHEFSMMMTIALRFIPTLIEETEKIMNAQKARGADFSSGGLIKRAKALIPIMVPLFVSAFRRADDLASAMESRCYTGGKGRTRMNVLHASPRDFIFALAVIAFGAGVVLLNVYAPGIKLGMY